MSPQDTIEKIFDACRIEDVIGNFVEHQSKNNLIFSPEKLTAVVGLENIGVINFNDITLVIDLSKSDELKYLIHQLKKK